ncbi:ROK family transcriptional regulator [Nonomuraea sp. NBC_01738]|uniref:ROK family transcriptional regulator n=1 Tax=Nonomuraea sp. NBC_01738 TaxID=2976003 RepID=UPI002E14BA4E|nr:ROK family transcriptional regulator [Nonomuraea sp. NBC_01738]
MKTATPAMARAINDRLALDLLLEHGPLTAPQLRELTGLSRPTVADLIERLREAGLIEVAGEAGEERRGPNARLFALVAERAHVAGVDIRWASVTVTVADLTGRTVGTAVRTPDGSDLGALVTGAIAEAAGGRALEAVALGAPGLFDPRTGALASGNGVPGWPADLLGEVRRSLDVTVLLENEVNLAAIAEHRIGAAQGSADFALLWLDDGVGSAVVLGGRLRRGASGGAGEIGMLAVGESDYCRAVQTEAIDGLPPEEIARKVAVGAFALVTILDPGLVVLGGRTGRSGGAALADLVEAEVARTSPAPTRFLPTAVEGNPILQGAVLTALDVARDRVFR